MKHPDLDRLTSWVHGLLEAGEGAQVETHLPTCAECRDAVEALHEEALLISREICSPEQMAALKADVLRAANRRPSRSLLWQIPAAAAVLLGLVAALSSPVARHHLENGRVTLEDGQVLSAPQELAAARPWAFQAQEQVRVRLSDRSTVDLGPGSRISLAPEGARGVQAHLASGEADVSVAADPNRLAIVSPAGRVEATDGRFTLKIVFKNEGDGSMKNAIAGAIVTVFAGSISLSSANGRVDAAPGQSAVLAPFDAPLFLSAPQDKQEDLLRRLEQLAARVAKLEDEVAQLEAKNQKLKAQLTSTAPGAVWNMTPGQNGASFRLIQSATGVSGNGIVVELSDENEKKNEVRKVERKEK